MEKRNQLTKLAEKINRDTSVTRIGIVGSRKYPVLEEVSFFISLLRGDLTLVSGGATKGVDHAAEKTFDKRGMKKIIHRPNLKPGMLYFERCIAYYNRNKLVAQDSDFVVAFVSSNKGGTWNTIKWCKKFTVPHKIIKAF